MGGVGAPGGGSKGGRERGRKRGRVKEEEKRRKGGDLKACFLYGTRNTDRGLPPTRGYANKWCKLI